MKNILDELGIEANKLVWTDLSLCKGMNPAWFFEDYENDPEIAKQVDEVCLSCPVMKNCNLAAMNNNETGCWGAVFWSGSGAPDKNKNSHKTKEVWQRIKEKISA